MREAFRKDRNPSPRAAYTAAKLAALPPVEAKIAEFVDDV